MIDQGLLAPILTPFNDDGSVAHDLYVTHARTLLEQGCVGLVPFGTTGEGLSVGIDERMQAVDALIEGGVAPQRLLIGTGTTSISDTIRLTSHAQDRGSAGVLVLPPFYFSGATEAGISTYFDALLKATDIDVYLYHIPQVAGIGFSPDLAAALSASHERIVGIKDSSGDWSNTEQLLQIGDLVVYPGSELSLLDALRSGAAGCISATANINATSIAAVITHWLMGMHDRAAELHKPVVALRQTIQGVAPIPAQKAIIAHVRGEPRWSNLRPPLEPIADGVLTQLLDNLRAMEWDAGS